MKGRGRGGRGRGRKGEGKGGREREGALEPPSKKSDYGPELPRELKIIFPTGVEK